MEQNDIPPATAPPTEPRPDLVKRFLAFLVDSLIAGFAGALVGLLSGPAGPVASAAYLMLRDGIDLQQIRHRSIGKHVLGLRVRRLDGRPMDFETSLRRNWMFGVGGLAQASWVFGLGTVLSMAGALLIVYEIYRVLTDPAQQRWGDELAGTEVVDG